MKILVMRPSPSGENLVHRLQKIGIYSWHFSLFHFLPSQSTVNLSHKYHDLYESNIIILFSQQSVYYTNLYLENHNLSWPSYAQYFTIGQSTACFLCNYIKKKFFFLK